MIAGNESSSIVVAGGSGFIGLSLARFLAAAGRQVVLLSRHAPATSGPWRHVVWDARSLGPWRAALEGAAGLVNLVGRSVDCVKTPDHRDEIVRSRVEATRVLGLAMRETASPPGVWVQMSTAHIYGDPSEVVCTESSPLGLGLAPQVGRAWEEEFQRSIPPTQRGVVLRTSFVIGRDRGAGRGALAKLVPLARLGLGGRVGHGRQGMSWIHEIDLNRLIARALDDPTWQGVYIASAPNPAPQIEFMRALRLVVGMPLGLPAPEWLVRLAARWILKTDPELALYGRYVVSERLPAADFEFQFPHLRAALEDALGKQPDGSGQPARRAL